MQQERNVVLFDLEVAAVNVGDERQRIQVLNLRAFGIVADLPGSVAIADALNAREIHAVREFVHGVVEFLASYPIDGGRRSQALGRSTVTCGPTKAILRSGLALFISSARRMSFWNPGVEVNNTTKSYSGPSEPSRQDSRDGAARRARGYPPACRRDSKAIPDTNTINLPRGGPAELAPPSNLSKDGGFKTASSWA